VAPVATALGASLLQLSAKDARLPALTVTISGCCTSLLSWSLLLLLVLLLLSPAATRACAALKRPD
jgi:hypothetical protein